MINQTYPTYDEDGYTGDIVCERCEKLIKKGEVIPKLQRPQPPLANGGDLDDNVPNNPQTNGKSDIIIYTALVFASVIGLIALTASKKKETV